MAELIFTVGADTSEAASQLKGFLNDYASGAKQAGATADAALGGAIDKEIRLQVIGGEQVVRIYKDVGKYTNDQVAAQKALTGELGNTKTQLLQQLNGLKNAASNTKIWSDNGKKLTTEFKNVQKAIGTVEGALKKASGAGGLLGVISKKLSATLIASNLATGALQLTGKAIGMLVSEGMKMETLRLQIEAFAGSAEAADAAMTEFVDIAVKTPFNVQQVAEAGKIMMGFGVETDKAVDSTKSLALAASASGGQLDNLARNLGQISSQGRAYTRDLTQFAIQGIPIWEKLSDVTGQSTVKLKEMATEGKIGFDQVNGALKNLTQAGSEFYILAQKMEKSLQGQFEALVSEIQKFAGAIAEAFTKMNEETGAIDTLFAAAKAAIQGISAITVGLIENLGTIIKLVAAVGAGLVTWQTLSGSGLIIAGMKKIAEMHKLMVGLLNKRIALNVILQELLSAKSKGDAIRKIGIALAKVAAVAGTATAAYVILDKAMGQAGQAAALLREKNEALKQVYTEEMEKLDQLKTKMSEKEAILASLDSRLARYQELLANGTITQEEYTAELEGMKEELKAIAPAADEAGDGIDALKGTIETLKEELETMKEQKLIADRATEDAIDALNKLKDAERDRHDAVIAQIESAKTAEKDRHDAAKDAIDRMKTAEQERHGSVIDNLEKEKKKIEEILKTKLSALDEETSKAQAAYKSQETISNNLIEKEKTRHNQRMANIDREYQNALKSLESDDRKIKLLKDQMAELQGKTRAEKELELLAAETAGREMDKFEVMRKQALERQKIAELERKEREEKRLKAQLEKEEEERAKKLAEIEEKKAKKQEEEKKRFEEYVQEQKEFMEYQKQVLADKLAAIQEERKEEEEKAEAAKEALEEEKEEEQNLHEQNMKNIEALEKAEERRHKAVIKNLEAEKKAEDALNKAIIKGIDKEIQKEKDAKKARDRAYEDKKRGIEKLIKSIEKEIDAQKKANNEVGKMGPEAAAKFAQAYEAINKKIDEALQDSQKLNKEVERTVGLIDSVLSKLKGAGEAIGNFIKNAASKLADAAKAVGNAVANAARNILPRRTGDATNTNVVGRASGGPVTGGSTYTVNELGKEAFLSASGKLSMINAPAWGKWKAPSAGTVIPAHLTSKLDIPRNGINLNASASASAVKASRGGDTSLAGALARLSAAGDTISNNVTIQSANPNKTASDMLVELTKIRHRRYRR